MNNRLLKNINTAIMGKKFEIPEEQIMTGIVVYKTLDKISKTKPDILTDIISVASSYADNVMSTIASMKNQYVSYSIMLYKIKNDRITSILDLNSTTLEYLYSLYLDKTKIVKFSRFNYSPNMYSVDDLSMSENNKLRDIHFNIMVPLVNYYINKNGIKSSDVKIYTAISSANLPGKGILFSIEGIGNINIVNDSKRPSIGIVDKIYTISVYDNKVLLIVK